MLSNEYVLRRTMLRCLLGILVFGLITFTAYSSPHLDRDSGNALMQADYRYALSRAAGKIVLDGLFDEEVWKQTVATTPFFKKYPTDVGPVQRQTEVRMTFDEKNLYVAVIAYDSGKAFIRSLKRDFGHDGSDGIGIVIDPLNRQSNGFFFVVNAFNAQSEDQLSGGNGPNFSWDNKWFSQTRRFDDRWQAEIAIPFKTLRYNDEQKVWGINFVRIDTKTNEYSTWTKLPVNFPSYDLGYTGALVWNEAPPKAGRNMVFAPYVTAGGNSVALSGKNKYDGNADAGFDAKIGLNSSLNLDLTFNPDFSQIEVDQQVTNLTRFNIFFPERRTFFLENSDLFSNYGIDPVRPFYSRRIGLDENGRTIPILGGARLSGNVGRTTRIGLLNMLTGKQGEYNAENFTAATVNQRLLKRSMVKGYFLNRQSFMSDEERKANPLNEYGRNAGVELHFSDQPGRWQSWAMMHKSFKPGIDDKDFYTGAGVGYNRRRFQFLTDFTSVGTNYYADMGFIQRIENYDAISDSVVRLGFNQNFTEASFRLFPQRKNINSIRFEVQNFMVFNPGGTLNELNQELELGIDFANTNNLYAGVANNKINLMFPLSFTGAKPLPAATYNFLRFYAGYNSDYRKPAGYGFSYAGSDFYNGTYQRFRASVFYRKPPHLALQLNAELHTLNFPGDYGSTTFLLLSPRVDINFTTNIFWTTFLQYNTQANNFNVNSRFQWRYKPMSDLFLVYTDNYFTDPFFKNKNRALVLKATYWLNM